MRKQIGILTALLLVTAAASAQTATATKTYSTAQMAQSATLTASPASPTAVSQAVTLTGGTSGVYQMAGTAGPRYYQFLVTNPSNQTSQLQGRSTNNRATWTPTVTGTYQLIVRVQLTDTSGNQVGELWERKISHTVVNPKMTWNSSITSTTLGTTPASHLQGKKISSIINSSVSGRSDGRKCNECHNLSVTRNYRPDTTQTITKTTSILKGDAYNTVYKWNQSGSTGIVERFCNAMTPEGPKPADLCAVFRKWASDGYVTD